MTGSSANKVGLLDRMLRTKLAQPFPFFFASLDWISDRVPIHRQLVHSQPLSLGKYELWIWPCSGLIYQDTWKYSNMPPRVSMNAKTFVSLEFLDGSIGKSGQLAVAFVTKLLIALEPISTDQYTTC